MDLQPLIEVRSVTVVKTIEVHTFKNVSIKIHFAEREGFSEGCFAEPPEDMHQGIILFCFNHNLPSEDLKNSSL
jgi:hypothetical protein